mmetsp:Transcript_12637/g.40088  ORF Transcript_12637/g.40088 Transcript_12637/m.40088 type:complete len:197 (-) Transcript_12637:793-1383(-)
MAFAQFELWENMCAARSSAFPMDVSEDARGFTIVADLPGVPNDAVSVSVRELGVLLIKAERAPETGSLLHRERSSGSTSRAVRLPKSANLRAFSTERRDGVLVVRVPKKSWDLSFALPFLFLALTILLAPAVLVRLAPVLDFVFTLLLATVVVNVFFALLLPPVYSPRLWTTPPLWRSSPGTTLLLAPQRPSLFFW